MTEFSSSAKAKIVDQAEPVVSANAATTTTAATAGAAGVIQQIQEQLAPFSDTLQAVKYALLAVAVLGLGFTIYSLWKANQVRSVS